MKKFISCLLICLVSCHVMAQFEAYLISGKIVDAATQQPLQGTSVFAQSTTIGTATDAQGNFTLRLPNGGYDLIISFTGYQTTTHRIATADALDKNMVIEIKQKEKALEDVVIRSSNEVPDGAAKYGGFFLDNFIGKTANSAQCSIKNPEVLKYYLYKKRNRLKILATAALEIENKALGYTIKYTLDSFTHEYATALSTYSGYPLFQDMVATDSLQKTSWQANRLKAYNGSMLHFMRSVHNQSLKKEGFQIQFVTNVNAQETAVPLQDYYGALNYTKTDSTQLVEITPNQQNLAVLYTKAAPDSAYLLQTNDAARKFQLSVLTIAAQTAIDIEQNGYFYDQNDILINGYWTWQKVADVLPYDFIPE